MNKFRYCSSLDELMWSIPDISESLYSSLTSEQLEGKRYEIRKWIEDNCFDIVYGWNETQTPTYGQADWAKFFVHKET